MNIFNLLFPRLCLGCRKPGSYFCSTCVFKIKASFPFCPVCEKPSLFGETHPICRSRYALDGFWSFFVYEGIIRKAIHKLKYKLMTDLEDELWRLCLREIKEKEEKLLVFNRFIKENNPIVVPIPLHWHKKNIRGFNQSTLIGKKLANFFNLPFSEKILLRQKSTPSQTRFSLEERQKNVKNIFSAPPDCLLNVSCLLVDDVWTTGSTLKEAGKTLKKAGAKKVWGLAIAC